MRERAVCFGPQDALAGVLCEPRETSPRVPGVIFPNSGLIHHIGVGRLHVRLARYLAKRGVPSLRFDLSMIGDSLRAKSVLGLGELVQEDMDAALGLLDSALGVDRFIAVGLCSGAYDSYLLATRRADVVGIAAVDLIADLQTWHHQAVHIGRRLFRWQSWRNTLDGSNGRLQRLFRRLRGLEPYREGEEPGALDLRPLPARDELRTGFGRIFARGGRVLAVFSGGLEFNYNHRRQLFHALPELAGERNLRLSYFGGCTHTFSEPEQQERLVTCIGEWVINEFVGARTSREDAERGGVHV